MPDGWVETVPNVSEGRRPEVIEQVAVAAAAPPGACLLDVHSDPDHNRSVLTIAGPRQAVAEAAFGVAAAAVASVDLRRHTGVHPRMGAVDVVPFVPLAGDDLSVSVTLARETGARIGDVLSVPVYLYGAAAAAGRPRTLPEIRGHGFEAMLELGEGLPPPDFGPRRLHPSAGAVAVGARPFLVAFNLSLGGADGAAARRIAGRVRGSSPAGLPGVLALGFWLERRGAAQVSLNLFDLNLTSPASALRRVRAEAEAEGVTVASAELVGLLPASALRDLEADGLPGLPGLEQTIEWRLQAARR